MKKLSIIICFMTVSVFAQAQWIQQYPNIDGGAWLKSVYFTDANTGYAVGYGGIIIKTIDGGITWNTLSSGTGLNLNSVFFTDSNTGYVVGGIVGPSPRKLDDPNEQIILKTSDGGISWQNQKSGSNRELFSVYFADSYIGYALGIYATILKTINGGTTWDTLSSDVFCGFSSVCFTDANTGYAAGCGILKTIDGGTTWTEVWSGSEYINSVFFKDDTKGYAVGSGGTFLKTSDAGTTWDSKSFGATNTLLSVRFTNANNGFAIGFKDDYNEGIIFKTIDGGVSWTNVSYYANTRLNSLFFADANTGYAVGTNGTILKTTNGGGFPTTVENQSHQSTFTIYPNPATNKITINTSNKPKGETRISIFSINGQLIQSEKFQNTDRFEMDVSAFAKGIYLLRMQSSEGVETQKLVLQ